MAKKLVVTLAALVLLCAGTFVIGDCYDKARVLANESEQLHAKYQVAQVLEYETSLRTLPYALKAEVHQQNEAYDVLLDVQCEDPVLLQRIKGVFGTYYGYWKSHIYEYDNIHTYVKDEESGAVAGTHLELAELSLQQLNEAYQIVLRLHYDETGFLVLDAMDSVGFEWKNQFSESMKREIENYMSAEVREYAGDEAYTQNLFEMALKPITNMEMIIAVPVELASGDLIYDAAMSATGRDFKPVMAVYAGIVCGVVLLASLFLPISVIRETAWIKRLLNIKIEILSILLAIGLIPGFVICLELAQASVYGNLRELILHFRMEQWVNELTALSNGLLWFVYLALVMFTAMLIRWIWNKGLICYLKENTCAAWLIGLFMALVHWFMNLFDQLLNFDLKDSINQLVIKITGINLIVMVLICCIFPAGIVFAVIYSVALFFFLRRKLKKIQADYSLVLDTAERLSGGNFNVKIDFDAGIFNSMNKALSTLKSGFQKAVSEEVKSQRMKSELITNVSHDLKTPLTSIITYVDLLKTSENEDEKHQYLETIDRNSHRLKNLIEDLFEVSKATSGNVSLHLMDVDLVSLIRQVILECEGKLLEKNLDVKILSNEEKIMLKLDSAKAFRIFENLTLNICKYALSNTRVFVNVEKSDETVKVIFKNISEQEIGFDPDEITERFVQGDKSRNAQGSGLGLAIVKSFTELHHGSFHVETDGDLFKAIVVLPLSQ